ncbi:MAG: hypothetical protein J6B95_00500 [Oscillospiraceae bacterium]|nr:hypothetical protein [Oscillospiraceae bacterium]
MTKFTIQLSSHIINVSATYRSTSEYCSHFYTEASPDFSITITPEDIAFERTKSAREDALEGIPVRNFSDAYLETLAVQRKITEELFAYDTLLFHGSVVAVDGVGYLFTAKSCTGKSTHTRLWREVFGDRAVMVNDDKPFLRITKDGVLACGSPWNGKHGLGANITVPLKAICILERGEENRICQIPAKEAVFMLLQQSNRPMDPRKMPKYLELLDRLSEGVSFYRLQCNMEPEAAKIAYEMMSKP